MKLSFLGPRLLFLTIGVTEEGEEEAECEEEEVEDAEVEEEGVEEEEDVFATSLSLLLCEYGLLVQRTIVAPTTARTSTSTSTTVTVTNTRPGSEVARLLLALMGIGVVSPYSSLSNSLSGSRDISEIIS